MWGKYYINTKLMKIDLFEILKDAPVGISLYSPLFGKVEFQCAQNIMQKRVYVRTSGGAIEEFDSAGHLIIYKFRSEEPMLFPSKEQRNWSEFKI